MVHSETEIASTPSSQDGPEVAAPLYKLTDVIACMNISARMLELAHGGNDKNYLGQARLLRAAADDLLRRIDGDDQ